MPLQTAKPWYRSNTIYALAVSALAHLLVLLGAAETMAQEQAATFVTAAVPIIGIAADAYGAWARKRAQGPLTLTGGDQ